MENIQINGGRLWDSLMEMAKIGATPRGGNCRLALTELDRQGRDLFVRWCREAGCQVSVDRMGNIFARRPGRQDVAPVGAGSHLDTQPTGGKYDGVYGVLAALEVVRTLNDYGVETDAPVEIAMWTNEEGARFAPAMVGSGVFAGAFDLDYGHSRADGDGITIGEALEEIHYLGDEPCGGRPFRAFFEVHIEQGPILEAEAETIGVVTGAQGQYWYNITVSGFESHAGTTPMDRRRDALVAAARLVTQVQAIALSHPPHGVSTVGVLQAKPGSRNTIPGEVFFSVDFRHPQQHTLDAMDAALQRAVESVRDDSGCQVVVERIWHSPPVVFDPSCVAAVRQGSEKLGLPHRDMVSGAGHDACYISRVAPTGMIFVPCKDGISHNEAEEAKPDDLSAGCNVLLHAILDRAER